MRWIIAAAETRMGLGLMASIFCMMALTISGSYADTPPEQVVIYESHAYDLQTQALRYSERHVYHHQDGKPVSATVHYLTPDGEQWATKHLSFANGSAAPFFHRQNLKSGYQEGFMQHDGDDRGLLFHQKLEEERKCEMVTSVDQTFIVDAGFNQYLQSHLSHLQDGKALRFDILVPKACRTLEFEAKSVSSDDPSLVTIHMQPTSFLARLVVPKTQVRYSRQTGALVDYRGLSDLTDDQGRTMRVEIRFAPPVVMTAEMDSNDGGNRTSNDRKQRDAR